MAISGATTTIMPEPSPEEQRHGLRGLLDEYQVAETPVQRPLESPAASSVAQLDASRCRRLPVFSHKDTAACRRSYGRLASGDVTCSGVTAGAGLSPYTIKRRRSGAPAPFGTKQPPIRRDPECLDMPAQDGDQLGRDRNAAGISAGPVVQRALPSIMLANAR